jgi:hypothetical protein
MTAEVKTYLADLKARHAAVIKDLACMPDSRIGSEWQLDRVDEALWLADEIARVEKRAK